MAFSRPEQEITIQELEPVVRKWLFFSWTGDHHAGACATHWWNVGSIRSRAWESTATFRHLRRHEGSEN